MAALTMYLSPRRISVLGVRLHAVTYEKVVEQISRWAAAGESRMVCAANVHMVMEAWDALEFRSIINGADLVTPDGMPLVWAMRFLGGGNQERVYGPDLMLHLCRASARNRLPVGLLGGSTETLSLLRRRLQERFPDLEVVYAWSPPFRKLSNEELTAVQKTINSSGAKLLFVALGCPKQEKWMSEQRGHIQAVMIGVGAAFDFHAGRVPQAPGWIQRSGFEWLFRLAIEPSRLWRRYLYHNPRFLILLGVQLLGLGRCRSS